MRPEDILERDFLVGLRGYDKDEVRAFLSQIADEHGALLAELDAVRSAPAPAAAPVPAASAPEPKGDDFENLGASVAAILRTAKASASEVATEAEQKAAEIREAADQYADSMRGQASDIRAAAQQALDDAKAEAERVIAEAADRVRQLEIETDARIANKLADVDRHEAATRDRLREAAEELQLALMALGEDAAAEPVVDVREVEVALEQEHEHQPEHASGWAG
jgi:DivIVA domain-containing protein